MSSRIVALWFIASATLSWTGAPIAQERMKGSPSQLVGMLKVGQWVMVKGPVQKDRSVLCTEAKMLTGDFLDDDWVVNGVVKSFDPKKQEIYVFHIPIRLRDKAEFDNADGTFKGFGDLKAGMYLDLEGTYLKSGTFLAKEVEDKSDKLPTHVGLRNELHLEGKVEKVDVARRTVTVMGTPFIFSEATRVKSVIK